MVIVVASIFTAAAPAMAQCTGTVLSHRGGSATCVSRSGDFLYVAFGDEITVYDVSTIDTPVKRGSVIPPGGDIAEIVAAGTKVYAIGRLGLTVVNANNPDSPVIASTFAPAADMHLAQITTSNQIVYMSDRLAHVIYVVDVSAPANPVLLDTFASPSSTTDLAADGTVLCVASYGGIKIYDVTIPSFALLRSTFATGHDYESVALRGTLMCVGRYDDILDRILQTVDVSNLAAPSLQGAVQFVSKADNIVMNNAGTVAYADCAGDQIQIVDISSPNNPQILSTISAAAEALFASPNTLFGSLGTSGLFAWNVNTLTAPVERWHVNRQPQKPAHLAANSTRVVVADGAQLEVMDITTPGSPTTLNRLAIGNTITAVCITGNLACVADDGNTLSIVDLAAGGGAAVIGTVATVDVPSAIGADGTLVCVGTEADTMEVFDITNPVLPVARSVVPNLDGPGVSNPILDVKVRGDRAYVGQNEIWIISLANPSAPAILSNISGGGKSLALTGQILATVDGYSLELFNVADPANPVSVWYDNSYIYPESVAALESLLAIADDNGLLHFLNISNPTAPAAVSVMETDTYAEPEVVVGGDRFWRLGTFWGNNLPTGLWEIQIPEYPRITSMPLDQQACANQLLALSVGAHVGSLSYHWYWNGFPLSNGATGHGSTVVGSLAATLLVFNAQPTDSGNFHCVVTNSCGSVATLPAQVTIGATGDMNCDCTLDITDVGPFVLALVNPTAYAAAYPSCNLSAADVNADGAVNGRDISPFVAQVKGH